MRSGAILLVECDHCHLVIEAPLTLAPHCVGVWESYGVNGYLAQRGWVSDADGNDYCGAACYKAATKGRKEGEHEYAVGAERLAGAWLRQP